MRHPAMHVLWFEFMLSLRRLARRKTQTALMFVTFAVSLTLSLLSWSLFSTIFLTQPEFDPKGEYLVMSYAGSVAASGKHSTDTEMRAYKAGQKVFADFAEVGLYASVFLQTPDGSERSSAAYLSSRALQVVGARPLLGRLFTSADDKRGATQVALLSQRTWENSYGSDPHVLGKTVKIFDQPVTIVGVMPAGFRFPNDQDLWISYGALPDEDRYPLRDALVRLKPGVTRRQAEGELQAILAGMGAVTPANKNGLRPALMSFRDFYLVTDIHTSALILFALSLLFVVLSCANSANLMLIDFFGHQQEVATALALGIPKEATVRSVCWQVGVIAAGAALLGLALLPVAGPLLYEHIKFINAPYWMSYHFEKSYLGIAAVLAIVSAGATVTGPILYLWWMDPDRVIREHASASRGSRRGWWRRVVLMGQIALLTVIGVSAGLLVRSSYHVDESHWGFPAGQVFMGKIGNLAMNFAEEQPLRDLQRFAVHRRVLDEIERRPATLAAAIADDSPGYSHPPSCSYALDPAAFDQHAAQGEAWSTHVSEGFFDTLGVPFVAGGSFTREDPVGGPAYAVVNASLAAKLWPGQDPLQRVLYVRYAWMKPTDPPRRLVISGVVRDFQASGPLAVCNDGIFTSYKHKVGSSVFLFVQDRSGLPTARSLTDAVHRGESGESLYFPSTIKNQITLLLSSIRMTSDLTTVFAAAAVLLCAIGVYSLTVAQVLQSSREFGIRMALGAEPRQLWLYFTRGHLLAALIGVAFGLVGATQVVRVLGSLLYGVDPHSAPTYAGVAVAIMVVAALACIPSLFRLKRINPADCLRSL
jgi:predicted permease